MAAPTPVPSGARVLVAMSGGVDSSVAAALLLEAGYDVAGVTMRLWGGESDTGCCSVADTDDARRVAQQLDIPFHVFNFADDFDVRVVDAYVAEHQGGRTPNPCIECNRHLKFDRLLRRAEALGFDAVATGHHARIVSDGQRWRVARGRDPVKDQSYVLHPLDQRVLRHLLLPIGDLHKDAVRQQASRLGLRTADKPDSQDVCFITSAEGRRGFLERRLELHPGRLIDAEGDEVGAVEALELVTVGQRKGLGLAGGTSPRFVVGIDHDAGIARIGSATDLLDETVAVEQVGWSDEPVTGSMLVQCSAHGVPRRAIIAPLAGKTAEVAAGAPAAAAGPGSGSWLGPRGLEGCGQVLVRWEEPQRRVAAGQSVVFYDGDRVLGGGVATA